MLIDLSKAASILGAFITQPPKAKAYMYKDEATLLGPTADMLLNLWYIIDVPSLVDVPNITGIVVDSNGEFHNQTGREIEIDVLSTFTFSTSGGTDIMEISLGINNGAGYNTDGSDLYDGKQRWKSSTTTTQKGRAHSQTAVIPVDAKFALLVRNMSDNSDALFRYWSFMVTER